MIYTIRILACVICLLFGWNEWKTRHDEYAMLLFCFLDFSVLPGLATCVVNIPHLCSVPIYGVLISIIDI